VTKVLTKYGSRKKGIPLISEKLAVMAGRMLQEEQTIRKR
jgi:hypothetical protein